LDDAQVQALTLKQVDGLSATQISALGDHIAELSPDKLAVLDGTQINGLTARQVTALGSNIVNLSDKHWRV
jgi:hypothetical protein